MHLGKLKINEIRKDRQRTLHSQQKQSLVKGLNRIL